MPASINPARTTYRVIHNPKSGNASRNARNRQAAERFFRERRIQADFVETAGPNHATALAAQAVNDGCPIIVAMGGDGTMNEVARAVTHSDAVLGLIPCGSGNGLGRHLGLQGSVLQSLHALVSGRVREIDTGTADQHPFFNVTGIGYDADLSVRFNSLTDRGFWPYLRTSINLWRKYRPSRYVIHEGQQTHEFTALMVAVANSDQYGYNCFIAPGAKVDDGLLNLTVVRPVGALGFTALAYRMRRGSTAKSPAITLLTSDRFTIERPQPGYLHTDGEVHEAPARIDVAVQPRSLRILVTV